MFSQLYCNPLKGNHRRHKWAINIPFGETGQTHQGLDLHWNQNVNNHRHQILDVQTIIIVTLSRVVECFLSALFMFFLCHFSVCQAKLLGTYGGRISPKLEKVARHCGGSTLVGHFPNFPPIFRISPPSIKRFFYFWNIFQSVLLFYEALFLIAQPSPFQSRSFYISYFLFLDNFFPTLLPFLWSIIPYSASHPFPFQLPLGPVKPTLPKPAMSVTTTL